MPRKTIEERKAQLHAKLQDLQQKARDQQRAADTRMKVLIGGAMLADLRELVATRDPSTRAALDFMRGLIERRITRPADARAREMLLTYLAAIEAEFAKPLPDASAAGAAARAD